MAMFGKSKTESQRDRQKDADSIRKSPHASGSAPARADERKRFLAAPNKNGQRPLADGQSLGPAPRVEQSEMGPASHAEGGAQGPQSHAKGQDLGKRAHVEEPK